LSDYQTILIHAEAPPKPALRDPCNGCGICCVAEPCPLSRLLFWQKKGPCRAIRWDEAYARYVCGMVVAPSEFLPWLPGLLQSMATRLFSRWIAAGKGCDSDAEPGA